MHFVLFLVMPLGGILMRGPETPSGLGPDNFTRTFASVRFWGLVANSLATAGLSTILTVSLTYGDA